MIERRWCNGSHARFRAWCPKGRESSTPSLRTFVSRLSVTVARLAEDQQGTVQFREAGLYIVA
jgi:hypothetical protein